jgi:ABC-type multidrug transport system ATPase subunit
MAASVPGMSVRAASGTAGPAAAAPRSAVLAAGVGLRRGRAWSLRAASFRLESPLTGEPALGVLTGGHGAAAAVIDLLAGLISPSCGELRVLGEDMRTGRGRAAARPRIGVVSRSGPARPGLRVRGLVEHATRRARLPRRDRSLLAAAILDRLFLTPWADVPLRSAPELIVRRARLAAAAVHQPELLLIDGLLDGLPPAAAVALAGSVRDISRDTGVVAVGRDAESLALACGEVLTLADGILVGGGPGPGA